MLRFLALLDEPFQQILLSTEVDFVWCTTAEDGARDLLIVLGDIECYETPHRSGTVECVQKEPGVL